MEIFFAVVYATLAWFIVAAVLFFNPFVDKIYSEGEDHPAVKSLPKSPATIGKILLAVLIQCILWAIVYVWINNALPQNPFFKIVIFGTIISFIKIIPRDIDRILLTTYPIKRMTIEFIIGLICSYVVAFVYVYQI